jgi:hypothetical protein
MEIRISKSEIRNKSKTQMFKIQKQTTIYRIRRLSRFFLNLLNNHGNLVNPINPGRHLNLFRISGFEFRIY